MSEPQVSGTYSLAEARGQFHGVDKTRTAASPAALMMRSPADVEGRWGANRGQDR
jgi:hypothetical protein